ncbi:MAG: amidohydrolase family protein [Candidatus Woesearchaeota archaeon]|nr:amidohydrolase family protein [Candidatus Woesearchaeota archaeon]
MALIIKNCRLMQEGKEVIKNICIAGGQIIGIREDMPTEGCYSVLDAKGNFVIPGIIDPHVHFREPGLTHKEDLYTGSCAAAAGGITTFFDMPNTMPPTLTCKDLMEKKKLAKEKSIVNYGFYIGASADNLDEIKKANEKYNIPGTKLFMNLSTGKMMIEDKNTIKRVFENSRLVAVHAEGSKVEEAINYAIHTKTRLYLCHISTAEEIEIIKKYRKHHQWARENIFVEATPHHLFMTEDDCRKKGAFAKMIPTLKTKKDQEALWKAIYDGTINAIGTDHAPHTIEEKKSKDAPSGVPGEETILPLLLNAINKRKRKLTLERIVELTSKNPAKIFGIKNKGLLKVGYDADLAIIDINLEKDVKNGELKTKCRWSPFERWKLKGWPVTTIANGNIVFNHGKIYKNQGREVLFRGQNG